MIKWVFSTFSVLALSFCFSLMSTTSNVSAVQAPITPVNDVVLPSIGATYTCDDLDVTNNLYQLFTRDDEFERPWAVTPQKMVNLIERFNLSFGEGVGWGVTLLADNVTGDAQYLQLFAFNDSASDLEVVEFGDGYAVQGFVGGYYADFYSNSNWSDCRVTTNSVNNNNVRAIGQFGIPVSGYINNYERFVYYINASNITYPAEYEGFEIPTSEPSNECPDDNCVTSGNWQPSFDFAWDDKEITLTDKTPLEKIDEYNIDKCYWEVHDGNWDDLAITGEYDCDDHTPVVYDLPTYESYQIGLNYYDSESGTLYTAEYLVNIDGGSGSDSINDPFYSTAIGRVFKKHMNSDYGLEKFFLAPINFVASLPSKVGSCSPINYTLMGENVQLKCLSTTVWNRPFLSTIVNIYQILLLAGVTYFVATSTYHVIKSATNPLDDKLDVLKL